MKNIRYTKRMFLNKLKHHSIAAGYVDVCLDNYNLRLKNKLKVRYDISAQIVLCDCYRIISIEFFSSLINKHFNSMLKNLDKYIKFFIDFKTAIIKAQEELETKDEKYFKSKDGKKLFMKNIIFHPTSESRLIGYIEYSGCERNFSIDLTIFEFNKSIRLDLSIDNKGLYENSLYKLNKLIELFTFAKESMISIKDKINKK